MAAQVIVLVGPVRSGKTSELLRTYHAALETASAERLGAAFWLAPNGRTAATIRDQLVRMGLTAALSPGVLTFADLTRQILNATNIRLNPIDSAQSRDLFRRVVAKSLRDNKLSYFAESAARPGFIELLADHISELKRRDIRPDTYASMISRRLGEQPHQELAHLYTEYEALLATHNLIDAEGSHMAAREALAQNTCRRFENVELVVADGFSDLTGSEIELLQALSRRSKQLLISLPADSSIANDRPGRISEVLHRPDLFAKTAATLSELHHYFPDLEMRQLACRPLPSPAINYIAQQIFRNPTRVAAPTADALDSLSQVEIVEAASAQDEIVQIARRVKALLTTPHSTSPTRPGDVLVVFRSLTEVAPRVREV
ncbi:MAG TPA: UvrD-helicase domain-containing protein, partial [Lacipirellulaceae bacterium]|nr:UvrD-helicase domain-containing protein [Lacipirellulaceae bacterium]